MAATLKIFYYHRHYCTSLQWQSKERTHHCSHQPNRAKEKSALVKVHNIQQLMNDVENWVTITEKEQYHYPGTQQVIMHCSDIATLPQYTHRLISNWDRTCRTAKEKRAYNIIASCIPCSQSKVNVILHFQVLCGQKAVEALHLNGIQPFNNSHWEKAKLWVEWWTRRCHLQMLCKEFSPLDDIDWSQCSKDTNAVEKKQRIKDNKHGITSIVDDCTLQK